MPPRPLLRPAPRSAMFFPLVVIAAILPGLYALNWWDLNPPGPWWGLRGLAVLEGRLFDQVPMQGLGSLSEVEAYHRVALQPPLYAWFEALGLWLSPHRDPLMTVLPSYAAGALVVMLVYLHGRLWSGMGLGLTAAVLTGFNRDLLVQMQQATPTTLGLAGLIAALLCYGQSLRAGARGSWGWAVLGGLALGASLMALGLFALIGVPVVLLHQAILKVDPGSTPTRRSGRWWRAPADRPRDAGQSAGPGAGLAGRRALVCGDGHTVRHRAARRPAGPTTRRPRWSDAPFADHAAVADAGHAAPGNLRRDPRGAAGAGRRGGRPGKCRRGLLGGLAGRRLAGADLLAGRPRAAMTLLLLVPLNLLAAQAMIDLATRRIPARTLVWLAPATALSVAWWISADLREAITELSQWRRPDASTLLGLHLGIDLIVILALATRRLDRWARRRDDRRRLVLGAFLLAVLGVNAAAGLREVRFRHVETAELLDLRDVILRRERTRRFTSVVVVAPETTAGGLPVPIAPGGRLRFILRATLPNLSQFDLNRPEELLNVPTVPDGQRLVILVGSEPRLSYSMQSQLGLESFYPTSTEPLGSPGPATPCAPPAPAPMRAPTSSSPSPPETPPRPTPSGHDVAPGRAGFRLTAP